MKRYLHVYWLYSMNSIKVAFQNRFGVVLFTLGKIVRFGMFGVFVFFLLQRTELLAGYTLEQTLLFFLTFNIVDSIAQLLFREVYRFRQLIVTGDYDTVIVKPIHPFIRVLLGGFDILDTIPLMIYFVVLFYIINQVAIVSPLNIISYGVLVVNSIIIAAGFHIAVLALGILTTEVDHTIMIYRDLIRMGTFPIEIYSQPVRAFLTFVVPLGVMISFPVQSLLGLLEPFMLAISLGIGIISITLALFFWNYAMKVYQSASS